MTHIVFIHGWGFDSRVWRLVAEHLASRYRTHFIDLPGYGARHFNTDDLPADATLCAWSLGAFTALRWAVERPDRVARLVLVGATPCFCQAADWSEAQAPELLAGFSAGLATDAGKTLRRFAGLVNQGDARAKSATRALQALAEPAPPLAVLVAGLDELGATDLRPLLPAVRQPTLLLHGEQDPLMPLAAARKTASLLPQGRLEVIPAAAHAPFLSQPDLFSARLAEFAGGT